MGINGNLGEKASFIDEELSRIEEERVVERIWTKDVSLWKREEEHQKIIRNALGWLDVVAKMRAHAGEIEAFARAIRDDGIERILLLGMGGSSLCPEVLRRTFGALEGWPELLVLDSTDPDTVANFASRISPQSTLFVVSSKSGTTIEPLSFFKFFYERAREERGERAGHNFIAITDPGTPLERLARERSFRRTFTNPPDIGGRYSALSLFGLVPAALMGLDVARALERAEAAMRACGPDVPVRENPAARLGVAMGACAREGQDKLTLIANGRISSFGLWVEQLIAESTGKEGVGIVPVAGEPLGEPEDYADDRLFVAIQAGEPDEEIERKLDALASRAHPILKRSISGAHELWAEFFTWEMATAIAGALLGIDPFDQPNVQESKDRTAALLGQFAETGDLPEEEPLLATDEVLIYGPRSSDLDSDDARELIRRHLAQARMGRDYIALLVYLEENEEHDALLSEIRRHVRDRLRVATTAGYGPRYLHSTGQLHKGGPDTGVFLLITADARQDLPVPGERYSFGALERAQALGDFAALLGRRRRALRLHFRHDTGGLNFLLEAVQSLDRTR